MSVTKKQITKALELAEKFEKRNEIDDLTTALQNAMGSFGQDRADDIIDAGMAVESMISDLHQIRKLIDS